MIAARRSGHAQTQRGAAMVAVLWIIAALTVLVTGVVASQRDELRIAQASRATVVGAAAGQAAIQLVLQRMRGNGLKVDRLMRLRVPFDGREVQVEVMPLNGLINITQAPEPLLVAMLAVGAGLPDDQARSLAAALVQHRTRMASLNRRGFDTLEDLLTVPGANYDLYASIVGLATTDSVGSGRVNPMAAPVEVLRVLAGGDAVLAGRIAADRDAGVAGVDTSRLATALVDNSLGARFRLSATVAGAGGEQVVVVRDVDLTAGPHAPWQVLRSVDRFARVQQGSTNTSNE